MKKKKFEKAFLPVSKDEMVERGWYYYDFLVVTADAYIDHPSFGTAIIARVLEAEGYRVAVLAQPDWHSAGAFREMGRPRYGVMIGGGNIDSMVAHYTAAKKHRTSDLYSPGSKMGLRPDRPIKLRRKCVGALVRAYFFIRRAVDVLIGADLGRARHERRAANICQGIDLFTLCESTCDRARGIFAHAVDKKVCLRVENERTAHLVVPVVIVSEPAQGCLQSPDDQGDIPVHLPDLLTVHQYRPIRSLAGFAPWGIGILRAFPFGGSVMCHHGVDVAGGHQKSRAKPRKVRSTASIISWLYSALASSLM